MRVDIQVKSAYLSLGKKEQGTADIDCQALFDDYWSTTAHEFTVRSQLESPTVRSSLTEKVQRTLLLGNIVAPWNYISLQKLPFVFR
jgi:hypothetical protein